MECEILSYNTHGLPWSRNTTNEIVQWIKDIRPSIVCLQEVFCESNRQIYTKRLERSGYIVSIPNDTNVTMFSSGLLIAVLEHTYTIENECFCSFQDVHNIEIFANKGFHVVQLREKQSNRIIKIANTHTQSSTELTVSFETTVSDIRRKQIAQMLSYFSYSRYPVLVVGDMNCEHSPHPHLRFLQSQNTKKHTFYSTGEDLDHVGWIPIQWAEPNCSYCNIDRLGPRMISCEVFQKPWSDHAPVRSRVSIPNRTIVVGSYL